MTKHGVQMINNWNCDGNGPHTAGEVRIYPIGGQGNLHLCRACWARENKHAFQRGRETGNPESWPLEDWQGAEVYGGSK